MDNEKMFDEFLGIHTFEEFVKCKNTPEDVAKSENLLAPQHEYGSNHIYQATYYRDLITIFNEVSMEPEDVLVDFGCGLGRVLFYGNSRHYCRTVGIESDDEIYNGLMKNKEMYQSKFLEQEDRMHFHKVDALDYEIGDEDNYFYFFNPFSIDVFKRVLANIISSVKKNPRDIYVITYYPTFEYQKEIRDSRYFVLKKIVKLSGYEEDPDEKVYVYHLSRYFV